MVESKKYVLFDTLVGRAQHETGQFIDVLVYLDVPLELALSRRMLRSLVEIQTTILNGEKTQENIESLREYLEAYSGQTGPRQIYLAIQNQVKPLADIVLDGEKSTDSLAADVLAAF